MQPPGNFIFFPFPKLAWSQEKCEWSSRAHFSLSHKKENAEDVVMPGNNQLEELYKYKVWCLGCKWTNCDIFV